MTPKTTNTRKKNIEKENQKQIVLIRDEVSQVLILADSSKALPVNKGAQLITGVVVSWQDDNRQRWRGPVLAVGTQAYCSKTMSTIENNSIINDAEKINSKKKEEPKLKSTITIEPRDTEQVPVNEEESSELLQDDAIDEEDNKLSQGDAMDEEDNKLSQGETVDEEEVKEDSSPLIRTKENSTISKGSGGLKRSFEENTTNSTKKKKFSSGSLTVPYATYSKMEQDCLALQSQVARYEQEWMPRPKDPKVIQYLIEITDILRGVHDDEDDDDVETLFENIKTELNMNEQDLLTCHRKSATATARQIMKHLYPIPTAECKKKLKDESFLKAAVKYTRISNPADPTTDVEIRHAMGNYVAAFEYKNRKNNGN